MKLLWNYRKILYRWESFRNGATDADHAHANYRTSCHETIRAGEPSTPVRPGFFRSGRDWKYKRYKRYLGGRVAMDLGHVNYDIL